MNWKSFYLLICIALLVSCKSEKKDQIVVYCAASLTNVMEQIKADWTQGSQTEILINSASSGTLARQIEYGAEADIFISANHQWMQHLMEVKNIPSSPKVIARNRLVVIANIQSEFDSLDFEQLIKWLRTYQGKISIGDPGHVPLGKYTKETLEKYDVYDHLTNQLIQTKDARSALRLVEIGEAAVGFVYQTDADSSEKVRVIGVVPSESHSKITYEAILIDQENKQADRFLLYLSSGSTDKTWMQHGFMR